MYKVIWLTKFRPDLPREQVLEWWRGHHGDVAKATPGMLRYVQSHWVSALDPATHQPTARRTSTVTPSTGSRTRRRTTRRWRARSGRSPRSTAGRLRLHDAHRRGVGGDRDQLAPDGRRSRARPDHFGHRAPRTVRTFVTKTQWGRDDVVADVTAERAHPPMVRWRYSLVHRIGVAPCTPHVSKIEAAPRRAPGAPSRPCSRSAGSVAPRR